MLKCAPSLASEAPVKYFTFVKPVVSCQRLALGLVVLAVAQISCLLVSETCSSVCSADIIKGPSLGSSFHVEKALHSFHRMQGIVDGGGVGPSVLKAEPQVPVLFLPFKACLAFCKKDVSSKWCEICTTAGSASFGVGWLELTGFNHLHTPVFPDLGIQILASWKLRVC